MSAPPTTPVPLILALVAAACAADKKAVRTDSAAAPTLVTLTATDYAFEAPDTIAAGFTTFRLVNNGDHLHMAQLIKLEGGRTLADFLVAYNEAFRTSGPRPTWATRRGGPGAADPRGAPTQRTAGRHVIRVDNAGAEPHKVGLVKLAPGTTMQDFEAWTQNLQGPPPASAVGGVSSLVANTEAYFEVELTSGEYVLLCFVTAPDGRPHTAHGMIQHIRIG